MSATDLSPLSASGVVTRRALGPAAGFGRGVGTPTKPPRGIYLPRGPISNANFNGMPAKAGGRTIAQRMGLAYESKVHDILEAIYSIDYRRSPSILFEDRSGFHRCIPDGILNIGAALVIVEIKLRHTERAYWQLERLYKPVLGTMVVPGTRVYTVEICRSYDPDEVWPGVHEVVSSLHKLSLDRTGVLQWPL